MKRPDAFSYMRGLDGLRAVAVLAVLVYHAKAGWLPGGLLGVEVFFVISGYLITSLLLSEWQRRDTIDVPQFWLRRARRLLPALFAVILGSLAFTAVFLPDEVASLRNDAAAAIGYITNWYLIFNHESYFETFGRPSLFRHLWSLAIEEQFYLLWPLLFGLVLGRLHRNLAVGLLVAGALASTAWMAILYQPGSDPSRVYYGTDTRASGLLIGAALAFLWAPEHAGRALPRVAVVGLDAAALAGCGFLAYAFLTLGQFDAVLYRGGFLATDVAAALVIAAVANQRTWVARGLGQQPLRWLGTRSYSIYLWHWPVFMLTRPQLDIALDGMALLALRLAITLVLAEVSYRLVETPVRSGVLPRAWRSLRASVRDRRPLSGFASVSLAAGVTAAAVLGVVIIRAETPGPPSYLAIQSIGLSPASIQIVAPGNASAVPQQAATTATLAHSSTTPTIPAPTVPPPPAVAPPIEPAGDINSVLPTSTVAQRHAVTAVGDSVMLGASQELSIAIGDLSVDASIGLQVSQAIDILQQRNDLGVLGDVVVVHLGNNGLFSSSQFDEIMRLCGSQRRLVFVNLKVPRDWQDENNRVLADGVARYPNAHLVDWHKLSADRPELFWDDGTHLRPDGAKTYAGFVSKEAVPLSAP